MTLGPLAASIELSDTLVVRYLEAARWYPGVLGYGGYGSVTQARVLGRILMTKTGDQRSWLEQKRGWRQFIDAQVPRQPVLIRLGDSLKIVQADLGGYLDINIQGHGLKPGWHYAHFNVIHRQDLSKAQNALSGGVSWDNLVQNFSEQQIRLGRATVVPLRIIGPNEKVGIVSDVDDTIIVTMVPRPFTAARNAFIHRVSARKAVPGMATFMTDLQDLSKQPGATAAPPVIYLSTGAWNVAPMLQKFLQNGGFPRGATLLRAWGPNEQGLPVSGMRHKLSEFAKLTTMLPHVNWLILGDDGQHDPTVYKMIGQRFPDRLAAVFIHTLSAPEHLLTHGSPTPLDQFDGSSVPVGVPILYGHDGHCLSRQIRQESFRELLRRRLG